MTRQEAKAWLNQAYRAKENAACIIQELNRLWEMAGQVTPAYGHDGGGSGGAKDKTAMAAVKIADKAKRYEKELTAYVEAADMVWEIIEQVPGVNERLVLRKRYLDFEPWEKIAEAMHYSVQRVYQIHQSALEEVRKLDKK